MATHVCSPEQKRNASVFNITGGISSQRGGQDVKYRCDWVRVACCSMTGSNVFISFPCSWRVDGTQPDTHVCVPTCVCFGETMTDAHSRGLGPLCLEDDAQWAISADRCQRLIKVDAHLPLRPGEGYE